MDNAAAPEGEDAVVASDSPAPRDPHFFECHNKTGNSGQDQLCVSHHQTWSIHDHLNHMSSASKFDVFTWQLGGYKDIERGEYHGVNSANATHMHGN